MKLSKKQTERLIEANIALIKEITSDYDEIVGYDLSRTATGRYQGSNGEGICFDKGEDKDIVLQLSYLHHSLNGDIEKVCDGKAKVIIGYERVSAMSHFSGLRAVTMAETLFLLALSRINVPYTLIPISSTALKKFVTGSGRYVDAKKKQMRKDMGLKSKDDPVKHLIMAKMAEDYGLVFDNDNIADAATLVVFIKALTDVCSKCQTYTELLEILEDKPSHQRDTLISFLSSWELIKENKSAHEYSKIRKNIRNQA